MPQRPTDSSQPPALFIVGMPRAATTWLCRCFNEHPQTAAFGETMFFGRRFVAPAEDGRYDAAHLSRVLENLTEDAHCIHAVQGEGPGRLRHVTRSNLRPLLEQAMDALPERPTPAETYAAVCSAIVDAEGKTTAVEKTPHHLNWLDRITSACPHSRIVILLREPYSFMLSYKHQGDRKSDELRRLLRRLYHPMACSMVWRASMRSALAARSSENKSVLLVEHDEIATAGGEVLERVQRFFDLRPTDLAGAMPAMNTSFPDDDARPSLRADDVFWMNLIAGSTMKRAGYDLQRVPLRPLVILLSILRLPVWGIGCALAMRSRIHGSMFSYAMRWLRPSGPHQAQQS